MRWYTLDPDFNISYAKEKSKMVKWMTHHPSNGFIYPEAIERNSDGSFILISW
jgi:hypothetical protein